MIEAVIIILVVAFISWPVSMIGLSIIRQTGNVSRQIAIDIIEIFVRWEQSKFDVNKRQAELEYWQNKARLELHERRQHLLGE